MVAAAAAAFAVAVPLNTLGFDEPLLEAVLSGLIRAPLYGIAFGWLAHRYNLQPASSSAG